ncbi:MAG: radical SAM protein, partial [Candidatus Adiutrix sp.]|jgi:radical SAM superfamily enzyme YgiQ (UPF0313 family)|nr:radical SAM protein [Candidatus Adiutrix sp.]
LETLLSQRRVAALSSLRLTAVTPRLAALLAAGRLQGAAVAPEGGSQRLRDVINKDLSEERILEGARLLAEAGLSRLKLYFMVGLPEENDDDLAALVDLCRKIRAAARRGQARPFLTVSLANFTPKAHTPFEEAPMATEKEFKRKGAFVAKALKGETRLTVNLDPPLWSIVQGLLARGGPESGRLVEALWAAGGRPRPALRAVGYTPEHPLHHPWPPGQAKAWRVVAPSGGLDYLAGERARAALGLTSPPCPPSGHCGRCRACDEPASPGPE